MNELNQYIFIDRERTHNIWKLLYWLLLVEVAVVVNRFTMGWKSSKCIFFSHKSGLKNEKKNRRYTGWFLYIVFHFFHGNQFEKIDSKFMYYILFFHFSLNCYPTIMVTGRYLLTLVNYALKLLHYIAVLGKRQRFSKNQKKGAIFEQTK